MKNVITLLSLLLLFSCSSGDIRSPEQQVRDTLMWMQHAAEKRSMSDFMQYIAEDYRDHQGNDKQQIKRILQIQFLRNQNINIFTRIQSLEVVGNTAAVEVSAAMAARDVDLSKESNRLKADLHQFSVVLKATQGDPAWVVQSVSWQRGWGFGV